MPCVELVLVLMAKIGEENTVVLARSAFRGFGEEDLCKALVTENREIASVGVNKHQQRRADDKSRPRCLTRGNRCAIL